MTPTTNWAQTGISEPWWPHPLWGASDQAGGSNWITPEKVLEALSVVKTGKIYELGNTYEKGIPLLGARSYNMLSLPPGGPSPQGLVFNDEILSTNIGQVGTQFDGPGHVAMRMEQADGSTDDVFYNGIRGKEIRSPTGLSKLGVEQVKPYVTRGILIDAAGYKGVDLLANRYEVTLADVRGALARQGLKEEDIRPGDALFFNYGWWRRWSDPATVYQNPPGIGFEVVAWIIEKNISMVGSDLSTDVGGTAAVHDELVLKQGIFNLEFMNFEALLADEVYEFLFIFTPLPFKGATGSPGRPIAIR